MAQSSSSASSSPFVVGQPEHALTLVYVNGVAASSRAHSRSSSPFSPAAGSGAAGGGASPCVSIYRGGVIDMVAATSPSSDDSDRRFVFDGVFTRDASLQRSFSPGGDGSGLAQDPRLLSLLEHLDKDGDGTVNLRELRHFYRKSQGLSTADASKEAATELDVFDLDSDGCMTVAEMCAGLGKLPPEEAEAWVVDKLKLTRPPQYTSAVTAASGLDEALFAAMVEPCVRHAVSMNCLLLGTEVGTGKTLVLFGADAAGELGAGGSGGGSGGGGGGDDGLLYGVLTRLFKLLEDLKGEAPGTEFLVVATFVAVPQGRNSKELLDLLRPPAQRGPKCLVTLEAESGFPVVTNLTRATLASEDDFQDVWAQALQRLRLAVLPQVLCVIVHAAAAVHAVQVSCWYVV